MMALLKALPGAMRGPVMAVLLFIGTSVLAEEVSDLDRFQLWNDCRAMNLVVEGLNQDAAEIGLTREAIETAVRSRLRAARLYDADARSYLYVQVTVVGGGYNVNVEYKKVVVDPASGQSHYATTWDVGGTGTHGRDGNYILTSTSQDMDRFLDEYLRVNADACE